MFLVLQLQGCVVLSPGQCGARVLNGIGKLRIAALKVVTLYLASDSDLLKLRDARPDVFCVSLQCFGPRTEVLQLYSCIAAQSACHTTIVASSKQLFRASAPRLDLSAESAPLPAGRQQSLL
eukprot:CAMPEP_0178454586 /NCGR_PEP_ID=MMETSP0689_2-20121128/45443_1 /TAXON_ID=160604 /ORGANISM="Amphidinium massartii, Strain CS-259" /LENGTH=121 /DNA_ID=CAMNT_0020080541 /DNA_START=254 /DNA_END=619 /DNA_ORIENTATION=-